MAAPHCGVRHETKWCPPLQDGGRDCLSWPIPRPGGPLSSVALPFTKGPFPALPCGVCPAPPSGGQEELQAAAVALWSCASNKQHKRLPQCSRSDRPSGSRCSTGHQAEAKGPATVNLGSGRGLAAAFWEGVCAHFKTTRWTVPAPRRECARTSGLRIVTVVMEFEVVGH